MKNLEEHYRDIALREMDLALEWKRRMELAEERFMEHIKAAEQATALWSDLIDERIKPKLTVVK